MDGCISHRSTRTGSNPLRFVGSLKERWKLTRALGGSPLPASWTLGDAFAETTEATGTAPLVSTVNAAVGIVIEHRHDRVAIHT